jgi:hypothetical protein
MEVKEMTDTTVIADTTDESHFFRSLFKVLLVVGVIAAITRFLSDRWKDFNGLTEEQARAKFEAKLGPIIGEDRAADVADQVIPRLKETGVLIEDAVDDAKKAASDFADEVGDTAKKVAGDAKKTASNVADEVGNAAKKAGDSVKGAASKAGDTVKDATEKVSKKVD